MNSINLLPKNIKDEIAQTKKNKSIRSYFAKSLLLLILVLLISFVFFLYLQQKNLNLRGGLEEKQIEVNAYGNLEAEAKIFAERLSIISKINQERNHWSQTLEEVNRVMPSGAYLTSISIDSDKQNRSQLTGFATSKNIVAILRNSMDQSTKFEFVDIESSSVIIDPNTQKVEENFIITFSLAKDALKEPKDE